MTECFEKARELGRLVLGSEAADRVRIAKELGDEEQILLAEAKLANLIEQITDIFATTVTGEMPIPKQGGHCGGCGRHG